MRIIRYLGVILVVSLIWVVVSALLRTMGVGQQTISIVGLVLLFIASPLMCGVAAGGKTAAAPLPTSPDRQSSDATSPRSHIAATIEATLHAANSREGAGVAARASAVRDSVAKLDETTGPTSDQGGYSGDYRLLPKTTAAGGVVFWIRNSGDADNSDFIVKLLVSEASNLPEQFRQRFLQGNVVPVRQVVSCPGGGYELHIDF